MSDQAQEFVEGASGEAVVRRFLHLLDSHQFDELDSVLASGLQWHLGATTMTRDETEAMIRGVYDAFPDFEHHVDEVLSIGDRVVARATDTATHLGEFNGVPATQRRITFGQISIYKLSEGKIVEFWEQADIAGLMSQITAE